MTTPEWKEVLISGIVGIRDARTRDPVGVDVFKETDALLETIPREYRRPDDRTLRDILCFCINTKMEGVLHAMALSPAFMETFDDERSVCLSNTDLGVTDSAAKRSGAWNNAFLDHIIRDMWIFYLTEQDSVNIYRFTPPIFRNIMKRANPIMIITLIEHITSLDQAVYSFRLLFELADFGSCIYIIERAGIPFCDRITKDEETVSYLRRCAETNSTDAVDDRNMFLAVLNGDRGKFDEHIGQRSLESERATSINTITLALMFYRGWMTLESDSGVHPLAPKLFLSLYPTFPEHFVNELKSPGRTSRNDRCSLVLGVTSRYLSLGEKEVRDWLRDNIPDEGVAKLETERDMDISVLPVGDGGELRYLANFVFECPRELRWKLVRVADKLREEEMISVLLLLDPSSLFVGSRILITDKTRFIKMRCQKVESMIACASGAGAEDLVASFLRESVSGRSVEEKDADVKRVMNRFLEEIAEYNRETFSTDGLITRCGRIYDPRWDYLVVYTRMAQAYLEGRVGEYAAGLSRSRKIAGKRMALLLATGNRGRKRLDPSTRMFYDILDGMTGGSRLRVLEMATGEDEPEEPLSDHAEWANHLLDLVLGEETDELSEKNDDK